MAIDIAAELAKHLAGRTELGFMDATLTKYTPGVRTPGNLGGGTNPTATNYTCTGIVTSFESGQIDGTLVKTEDRVIGLLGDTIEDGAVPESGDTITIDGETYRIVGGGATDTGSAGKGVTRDPVGAMYRCHARK